MTPEAFCYWLQGFFEIRDASAASGDAGLSAAQVEVIRKHLGLVMENVTLEEPGGAVGHLYLNGQRVPCGDTGCPLCTSKDTCTLPDGHENACNGHPRPGCCGVIHKPPVDEAIAAATKRLEGAIQRMWPRRALPRKLC